MTRAISRRTMTTTGGVFELAGGLLNTESKSLLLEIAQAGLEFIGAELSEVR